MKTFNHHFLNGQNGSALRFVRLLRPQKCCDLCGAEGLAERGEGKRREGGATRRSVRVRAKPSSFRLQPPKKRKMKGIHSFSRFWKPRKLVLRRVDWFGWVRTASPLPLKRPHRRRDCLMPPPTQDKSKIYIPNRQHIRNYEKYENMKFTKRKSNPLASVRL